MFPSPQTQASNVNERLNRELSGLLLEAREDLRARSGLHPDFIEACIAAIEAKKLRLGAPPTGEIFPHLVAQGLSLPDADRRLLAAAWLALYGYVCMTDYELDRQGVLSGATSLISSALLGWGIAVIGRYTAGTPFADIFLSNVNRAFAGQYQDIRLRQDGAADRRQSDIDKGRPYVAAIAGFCAAAGETDTRLVRAAEALLEPYQIFDDLEDLEEDFGEGNLTTFVRIAREYRASAGMSRDEMYRLLMAEPRTLLPLRRAGEALQQALLLLDAGRDLMLIGYLNELLEANGALVEALDAYQRDPAAIGEPEILQRIEKLATYS